MVTASTAQQPQQAQKTKPQSQQEHIGPNQVHSNFFSRMSFQPNQVHSKGKLTDNQTNITGSYVLVYTKP